MLPAHMHFGDWDWSALRSAAVGVAMAEQYVDRGGRVEQGQATQQDPPPRSKTSLWRARIRTRLNAQRAFANPLLRLRLRHL